MQGRNHRQGSHVWHVLLGTFYLRLITSYMIFLLSCVFLPDLLALLVSSYKRTESLVHDEVLSSHFELLCALCYRM